MLRAGLRTQHPVGYESLQRTYRHRLVHLGATPTLLFAGMMTHPAQDAGERHRLTDQVEGFLEATLGDESHVALDVDAAGAGRLAGRHPPLLDGEDVGHSPVTALLRRIVTKDGLARPAIDGNRHRADRLAIPAGSTPGQVHVARAVLHLNLEISPPTGQGHHSGVSQNFDVRMFDCFQHLSNQQMRHYCATGRRDLALIPMAEKRCPLHPIDLNS